MKRIQEMSTIYRLLSSFLLIICPVIVLGFVLIVTSSRRVEEEMYHSIHTQMLFYVDKFEAITAQRADSPNNCAVISYGGKTYINIIRNIVEPELERLFFTKLADTGLKIKIESNQR